MSSSNLSQVQANIETIFSEVNDKLEDLISGYRTLVIENHDDSMHERLADFCEELEDLKHIIGDENQDISTRIESVGNIAEYIDDLLIDVSDFKKEDEAKTLANRILSVIDTVEGSIGLGGKDSSVIEDNILQNPQDENESYFMAKQAELNAIVAANPELRNS
jgi:hypothetical protein